MKGSTFALLMAAEFPVFFFQANGLESSYIIPPSMHERNAGETGVYKSAAKESMKSMENASIFAAFANAVEKFEDDPFLGKIVVKERLKDHPGKSEKSFVENPENFDVRYSTYRDVYREVLELGVGVQKLGVPTVYFPDEKRNDGRFQLVGILGVNRYEWTAADIALSAYGVTSVTIHATFPADDLIHIFTQTELTVLLTEAARIPVLKEAIKDKGVKLKHIVIFDIEECKKEDLDEVAMEGIKIHSYGEVLESGKARRIGLAGKGGDVAPEMKGVRILPLEKSDINPQHVFTIVYTSGTTGRGKGVMLSNANWNSVIRIVQNLNSLSFNLNCESIHASFLPASHIFERMVQTIIMSLGGRIAFYRGARDLIGEDWKIINPTFLVIVPRIISSVLEKLDSQIGAKWLASKLVAKMLVHKKKNAKHFEGKKPCKFYDGILKLSQKIRHQIFGKNLKFIMSGAGKLNPEEQMKLRFFAEVPIVQGYGMTETSGACFAQSMYREKADSIGGPVSEIEFKIKTWDDYKADSTPPQGELLLRGPSIFVGYFREPQLTADALNEDGFLETGDVVELTEDGALTVIDRKKSLIKLAQGEYLQCEKLEGIYGQSPYVENFMIFGYDYFSYPIALVVPFPEKLRDFCKESGIKNCTPLSLKNNETFKNAIMDDLNSHFHKNKLRSFEKLNGVVVCEETWTPENGLLTPTFKLKRSWIAARWREDIDALYDRKANIPTTVSTANPRNFQLGHRRTSTYKPTNTSTEGFTILSAYAPTDSSTRRPKNSSTHAPTRIRYSSSSTEKPRVESPYSVSTTSTVESCKTSTFPRTSLITPHPTEITTESPYPEYSNSTVYSTIPTSPITTAA